MSVSEADHDWSEWSVRFEQLLVTGWSVSHTTEWHTDSGQMLADRVPHEKIGCRMRKFSHFVPRKWYCTVVWE